MTISKSVRFIATVGKGETIQLPEGAALEGSTIEVVLNPTTEPEKKMPATGFVEKWAGFFKGAELLDLDEARYQRIKNKHVK
jgi:hypothetical protein